MRKSLTMKTQLRRLCTAGMAASLVAAPTVLMAQNPSDPDGQFPPESVSKLDATAAKQADNIEPYAESRSAVGQQYDADGRVIGNDAGINAQGTLGTPVEGQILSEQQRYSASRQGFSQQPQSYEGQVSSSWSTTPRPVYHRDGQGRPIFQDAAGQWFVYSQGQWQTPQGELTLPQGFTSQQGQQATSGQRWPSLGIRVADSDRGVRVTELLSQSAAASAGLQQGDILLRANGQQISDSGSFVNQIRSMNAGDQVDLVVLRNGEEQTLNAKLDSPDQQMMAKPALPNDAATATEEELRQQIRQLEEELERRQNQNEEGSSNEQGGSSEAQNRQQSDDQNDQSAPPAPSENATEQSAQQSAEDAAEATEDAAEATADQARESANEAQQEASDAAESAADSAEQAAESAEETAEETINQ